MENIGNLSKATIINSIEKKHSLFVDYITGLTSEEFTFSYQQKWTAGQQVQHLILSLKPLAKIMNTGKLNIQQTFGLATQPSISYDAIVYNINEKLKLGGKASDRFLPETITAEQKTEVCKALIKVTEELNEVIEKFTENELDLLMLPHPLLGKITMREMLYSMIFHVEHHYQLTKQYLSNR